MPTTPTRHIPVLLNPVVKVAKSMVPSRILDATFGGGGYSKAFLELPNLPKVCAIDTDRHVFGIAQQQTLASHGRFVFCAGKFSNMDRLECASSAPFDMISFDLGLSTDQIKSRRRGFSFNHIGPLDMRMDQNSSITAHHVVNFFSQSEIEHVIKEYGEDKLANKIAAAICAARIKAAINSTTELAEIVKKVYGRHSNVQQSTHPATQTFQALRIFVNKELDELQLGLHKAFTLLSPRGIVTVTTFHSLEETTVTKFIYRYKKLHTKDISATSKCISCSIILPESQELAENRSSRSAKLFVIKRS